MARWLDVTMTCALSNGSTFLASNWIPNPRANGTALVVEATDLQLWNPKPSSLRSWSGTIRKRKRKPDALRLRPPTTRKSGIVRIRGARSISDKKEYITSASNAFFVVVSLLIFSIVFFFNSKNQYMTFDLYIDQFFPSSSYDNSRLRGTLWEFQLIRFFWQRSDLYDWGRRVGHRTIAEARSSRISSQCVVSPNYLNTKKTAASFWQGFFIISFFFWSCHIICFVQATIVVGENRQKDHVFTEILCLSVLYVDADQSRLAKEGQ